MKNEYPFAGVLLTDDNKKCCFSVWAPFAQKMDVRIHYPGNSSIPMTQLDQGYWEAEIDNPGENALYTYLIDGELERPDPASRFQPEGVHGPSAVIDASSYQWKDDQWKGIALKDMIIYEIHTGTFTAAMNFGGIMEKLTYLHALGVNTIELMPVAQFPGIRNWGYDQVFPYAVQCSYGTVNQLKELIDTAHQIGIAVILDVVYNHVGPEGNHFSDFGPYFTDKYHTPWAEAINFDDTLCDPVRAYYIQNALMWLDEFHIDGLRLDAVHAIWDCGSVHFTEELAEAVRKLEEKTGRKKILIAEIDYNSPRYITPANLGGYGLQGQWTDEFHHALHTLLTGEMNGYYADFGSVHHMAKSISESYVYTGEYSLVRQRKFGKPVKDLPFEQFVVFTQNHDQTGNRLGGERLSTLVGFEALKLAAATMLLSAHVPLLFMGEEYGETNPFLFFTDHSDPVLINSLREGRRKEFKNFSWEGEIPDPQSADTFQQSMLHWQKEHPKAAILFRYYQWLIHFRKTRPALLNQQRSGTLIHTSKNNIIAFERHNEKDRVLVLLNFGTATQQWESADHQKYHKLFDSSDAQWLGPSTSEHSLVAGIFIPPLTAIVYEIA